MAIDEFTTNLPAGAELAADPPSPVVFDSHKITIIDMGSDIPFLRLRGRWLDRAGFSVGTRVRVDVSERRLIVQVIPPEEPPHCADVNCPHEAKGKRRRRQPRH